MNGTTTKEVGLHKYAEFGRGNRYSTLKLLGARGVAVNHSNGAIAVTDVLTDKVNVFQSSNGTFQHQFEFLSAKGTLDKHLRHPMDIAVDSSGKHLVVNNSPHVRIYSASGQFEGRFNTLTPSDFFDTQVNLQCIATTNDGGVIFVGDHLRRVVTIHKADYNLLGSISTTDVQPAYLAHDNQRGHIAVSDDITGTICILDIEAGQKVLSFRAASGSRGVAFHEQSSSIFVTCGSRSSLHQHDQGQPGSVEQYCTRSGVKVGCPIQGLHRPYGLCLTGDNKLVVSDKDLVRIFTVEYP